MADKPLRIVVTASDQASGVLSGIGGSISGIGQIAAGVFAGGLGLQVVTAAASAAWSALMAIPNALREIAVVGYETNATLEQMGIAMGTLVTREMGLGASTADVSARVQELMGWIRETSILTPFTTDTLANTLRMSMAYGFTSEEAQRLTMVVGDVSAAMGTGQQGMERITRALGQMQARTRVAGSEMLQLTEAGIPAWQLLADAMGISVAELTDRVSAGMVSAAEAVPIFVNALETQFGGAMERQSQSARGLQESFGELLRLMAADITLPAFETIRAALSGLVAALSAPEAQQAVQRLGGAVGDLIDAFGRLGGALGFGQLVEGVSVVGIIDSITEGVNNMAGAIDLIAQSPGVAAISTFIDDLQDLARVLGILPPEMETITVPVAIAGAEGITEFQIPIQPEVPGYLAEIAGWFSEISEAVGIASAQLTENFGGAAAAIAAFWQEYGDEIMTVVSAVFQVIVTTIGGALTLIMGIISAALAAIGGNWQGAWDAIANSFVAFFDLAAGLVGSSFEEFVATWSANWQMLVQIVTAIWTIIVEAITAAWQSVVAAVTGVWDSIVDAFTSAGNTVSSTTTNTWQTIVDAITNALASVQAFITNTWQSITTTISNTMSTITSAITSAWQTIVGAVMGFVSTIANIIANVIGGIARTLAPYLSPIVDLFDAIWNAILEITRVVFGTIGEIISILFGAVVEIVSLILTAIQMRIVEAWNAIVAFIQPILETIASAITSTWETIVTAITTAMTIITTALTTAWQNILAVIQPIISAIATTVTTAWEAVATALTTAWEAVSAAIMGGLQAIAAFLTTAWQGITTAIAAAWQTIVDAITTAWAFVSDTITSGLAILSETWQMVWGTIQTTFATIWQAIQAAVTTAIQGVSASIQSGVESALGVLRGFIARFSDIGQQIIMGLVQGIRNNAAQVVSALRSIVDDAIASLRSSLGISSPSRVFERFGLQTMEGFARGLMRGSILPELSMNAALTGIMPNQAMMPALAGAGVAGMGGGSGVAIVNINAPILSLLDEEQIIQTMTPIVSEINNREGRNGV